jgi:hypothetical protein
MIHQSITPANAWQYASTGDIADTNAVDVAAAKTGYRHRVCAIQVHNSDTSVGTVVNIRTGSTVIGSVFVGPFVAAAPGNSYVQATYPMPLIGDVSATINVICVTTSAQVRVSVQGVTEKAS